MKKDIVKGIFTGNENGYGFVKDEKTEKEIFIPAKYVKDAFDKDTVHVKILEREYGTKKAEGKILKVLERDKDEFVGTFEKSKSFGFVVIQNKRMPTDIFIPKKYCKNVRNKDRVMVKITKYPEQGKKAEGQIVEVLGSAKDNGIDILSLAKEFDLRCEFPSKVKKEAGETKKNVLEDEIKDRVDLRNKIIFTIDGEDAKDLDDAVYVEKNENGNYVLNVSIADVSYYVTEDSYLNEEAILRGTSVYLIDRVIPMLPVELSNGICSLNEGQNRLALSVEMEIDTKGKILKSKIHKSIIKVTKKMTYTDVAKILIDKDSKTIEKYKEYINNFKLMEELALILKKKRENEGSLNLNIPESKIILDETGKAIDVIKYELNIANEIIENFMVTANEVVAKKFSLLKAPFIYRVHEAPDIEKIEELNKYIYNLGYKIKVKDDEVKPKEFAEVLENIKDKPEEKVISNLILRTLKIARYDTQCTRSLWIIKQILLPLHIPNT